MSRYVRGPTYARRPTPRFEFKPSSTGYTGGGYARIRSSEYRDHTAGEGADDVFVSVHRLAAVAWFDTLGPDDTPEDITAAEILESGELVGTDVHHTQPDGDGPGMPSANGEEWIELRDHGRHSEITQSQIRAWGEDAKRQALEYDEGDVPDDRCAECGEPDPGIMCHVKAVDGAVCLPCSKRYADDGEKIQVIE